MGQHLWLAALACVLIACASCGSHTDPGGPGEGSGVLPALPTATGAGRFKIAARLEDAVEVVLPANRPAKPPLLLGFHGTGGEPIDVVNDFDLIAKAASLGFVVIAPRAGYRDGMHPADVDHAINEGGSSWNMWTASPQENDDLVYLRALIDAASAQWGVDATRVYTLGFSNGAYFSYFAAASMPDRIAGFAENSGGWMTDACPTRTDADGASLYLLMTPAPAGQDMPCATIFADAAFPQKCRVSATNKLRPPTGARVPFGYIGHYSVDDGVSVVWSCLLAEGLGSRAQTRIRASDTDGTTGHSAMPNFIDGAWAFFAGRTNAQ
jgi:dienelactone hydrolase